MIKRSYNANGTDKITYKGLTLDLSRSIIKYGDKVADLTKNEVKILYLFLQKRGVIISRNEIMDYLWQSDNFIDDNTLTVNINRIRKKLSNIGIENFLINFPIFSFPNIFVSVTKPIFILFLLTTIILDIFSTFLFLI